MSYADGRKGRAMSDVPFAEIREWLANTDPAPDAPYYRDTRRYIEHLLAAYDELAREVEGLKAMLVHTPLLINEQEQRRAKAAESRLQLERQLADLTAEHAECERLSDTFEEKALRYAEQLAEAQQENIGLHDACARHVVENNKLNELLQEVRQRITALESENEKLLHRGLEEAEARDKAEARLAETRGVVRDLTTMLEKRNNALAALTAALTHLQAYARHDLKCDDLDDTGTCMCGLTTLRSEVEKALATAKGRP